MILIRAILLLIFFIAPLKANTIYNLIKIPNLEIYEINTKNKLNQADYLEISQKLANFHATCFTNSKNIYSKKSMLFFLEKPLFNSSIVKDL